MDSPSTSGSPNRVGSPRGPKGLAPLPPRRSSRARNPVDYRGLDQGDVDAAEQAKQQDSPPQKRRWRVVNNTSDADADEDYIVEGIDSDAEMEEAEGLDELAEAAEQAELLQRRHSSHAAAAAGPSSTGDARFTAAEARTIYEQQPLSHHKTTDAQYRTYKTAFEWWCLYEPEVLGKGSKRQCKRRQPPYSTDLHGDDGAEKAARFLRWYVIEGHKGYQGKTRMVFKSASTLMTTHSALVKMFGLKNLAAAAGVPGSTPMSAEQRLRQNPFYDAAYKQAQAMFRIQSGKPLPKGLDPHDNSEQDTFTYDELCKLAAHLTASREANAARDLSMLLWMALTCGRGDDARPRKLCELTEPKLRSSLGPSPAWVVGLVQLTGKTLGDGFTAKGCLRHKQALLCAQGALARWLITRFTVEGERFPDPTTQDWADTILWSTASNPKQPMSYASHRARFKDLYQRLDIFIGKVTHACRIFAARYAEEAGLSDAEIARLGFWALCEMQLCYLLTGLKASILLAMGAWDKDEPHMHWHERFMVTFPEELLDTLMPWYKELLARIQRADAANKQPAAGAKKQAADAATQVPAVHFSARGLAKLLPYLAFVAVQDALELCAPESDGKYDNNPVHKLLLAQDNFKVLLAEYSAAKHLGVFEATKPESTADKLNALMTMLSAVLQGQQAAAAGRQRQQVLPLQQPHQQQQPAQQQGQPLLAQGQHQQSEQAKTALLRAAMLHLEPAEQQQLHSLLSSEAAALLQRLQQQQPHTLDGVGGLQNAMTSPVKQPRTEEEEMADVQQALLQEQQDLSPSTAQEAGPAQSSPPQLGAIPPAVGQAVGAAGASGAAEQQQDSGGGQIYAGGPIPREVQLGDAAEAAAAGALAAAAAAALAAAAGAGPASAGTAGPVPSSPPQQQRAIRPAVGQAAGPAGASDAAEQQQDSGGEPDDDAPIMTMMVEEPGGAAQVAGEEAATAAAAGAGPASTSSLLFTPQRGLRPVSAVNHQDGLSPGGHAHAFWHAGCNNDVPQGQLVLLQQQPWKQPLFQQQQQQQDLGTHQDAAAVSDQQDKVVRLQAEVERLQQQLLQQQAATGDGLAAPVLHPNLDPFAQLLQPNINAIMGPIRQQPLAMGKPTYTQEDLMAAVRLAAQLGGREGARMALGQQHAGPPPPAAALGAAAPQAGTQTGAADGGAPPSRGAAAAAAASAGNAAAAAAGQPAAAGAPGPGAAAAESQPRALSTYRSFQAFWQWWSTRSDDWAQGMDRRRVSEVNVLVRCVAAKREQQQQQLQGMPGIQASDQSAVDALDEEMGQKKMGNLATFYRKQLKYTGKAAAAAAAAADGPPAVVDEAEAAAGGDGPVEGGV